MQSKSVAFSNDLDCIKINEFSGFKYFEILNVSSLFYKKGTLSAIKTSSFG
jgi:hypothetical protein